MKDKYFLIVLLCLFFASLHSQNNDSTHVDIKNGITKSSVLSMHTFGIFISRLQGNFKVQPSKKSLLTISLESANVWSAPVTGYIPIDENVRNEARQYFYHEREFFFDVDEIESKRFDIANDGVLKSLKLNYILPINKKSELNFSLRSFLLTNGKFPFTMLTGDRFIESFHSKIIGKDDPFARKLFGYDKAQITYKDRNDNYMEINDGDFILGGIETSYYYYPNLSSKTLKINFGAHLGTNLSKYNSSIDLGLSTNAIKSYNLNDRNYFQFGASLGLLRKNIINLKEDNLELGSNNYLGNIETVIEFNFNSKGQTIHSFGADFYLQTSLNKKNEFEYIIPIRSGVSEKSWVTGLSNLYRNNNYWTFFYSFSKKITTTFYLQQDLTLNNNPDIQTGIGISFPM